MVTALYNLFFFLLFLLWLPRSLYLSLTKAKYRESFWKRMGFSLPSINKKKGKVFWVHAVSVGEVKAILPFLTLIKQKDPEAYIVLSTVTETGQAEAKKSGQPLIDTLIYLPFDFSWSVRRCIQNIRPDYVILTEGDYWYNFLRFAKSFGNQIYVVSGKLSERSMQMYQKFPPFSYKLFSFVDRFLVQNALYRERFLQCGIPSEKITITGNLKFDCEYTKISEEAKCILREELGIPHDHTVITIGSTHSPEEKNILNALKWIWDLFPKLILLVVPRHPERFDEVRELLKNYDSRVLLVDRMGVLRDCYQLSTLAIVAGSFTEKVGGHNILEPAAYGVPVIFGPYMHTQKELEHLVLEAEAGRQVEIGSLGETIIELLSNETKQKEMGKRGECMVWELRGACEKSYDALFFEKNRNSA